VYEDALGMAALRRQQEMVCIVNGALSHL
jgi:phage FluMu protein gp41